MRQECAKRIAKVSADAKLEVDEETYLSQFKPHLMDVVYAWANGATFAQICKMTDVFEGPWPPVPVHRGRRRFVTASRKQMVLADWTSLDFQHCSCDFLSSFTKADRLQV